MSSLFRFGKSSPKSKKQFNTRNQLKDKDVEFIVNIHPDNLSSKINSFGKPLSNIQQKALDNALANKIQYKKTPNETARQKVINTFLTREGLQNDKKLTNLLTDINTEVDREKTQLKNFENRLHALNNKDNLILESKQEEITRRLHALSAKGGKSRRYNKKGSNKRRTIKKRRKTTTKKRR